jgi:hypothetical protein
VSRIFDGEKEAKLIALACSKPPKGRARWMTSQSAKLQIGSIVQRNASLPWAIAVSTVAAIAIVSMGGPSEFLYWRF